MTPEPTWTEADSRTFIDLADVAVAGRREALDMLVSLVPAETGDAFEAVDIGCGEGILLERLLDRFPNARTTGFDGSDLMREQAAKRLARFGDRVRIAPFALADRAWLAEVPSPARCILSSLAIHHVDDEGKRSLFRALASTLEPGGALLIFDLVQPATDLIRRAFADQWDPIAQEQSLALTGSPAAYDGAVADGWRAHGLTEPIPGETPSVLYEQLQWLKDAGLSTVDCFWMRAGVAIYGGYR